MKVVSTATMQQLDSLTIQAGVSGEILMERAGTVAAYQIIDTLLPRLDKKFSRYFTVLAGKGNNGGDAFVVAKHLAKKTTITVTIYCPVPIAQLTSTSQYHAKKLPNNVTLIISEKLPTVALCEGTIIIDGLLGIGCHGKLRSPYDKWVEQINKAQLPTVALDIPTGLNSDTGTVASEAIQAQLTITMAQPKIGMFKQQGYKHCGMMRCVDIGIKSNLINNASSELEAIFAQDISKLLQPRPYNAHKGIFGKVAIAGGSYHYTGAPMLSAAAAIKTGAGIVTVAIPKTAVPHTQIPLNALIVQPITDNNTGLWSNITNKEWSKLLTKANVLIFGPGIGNYQENIPALQYTINTDLPLILDADAINLLAETNIPINNRQVPTILTPHPREMKKLLKRFAPQLLNQDPIQQATKLANITNTYIILKQHRTIIATPNNNLAINTSGTNALATAGSGDVLAGIIAAFIAQKYPIFNAIKIAVFLHAYCSEIFKYGNRSLVADDIPNIIPQALKKLTPFP